MCNTLLKTLKCAKEHGISYTWYKAVQKIKYGRQAKKIVKTSLFSEDELAQQRKAFFPRKIKFSIVVPLYNTPEKFLREMIQSVIDQTYGNWELCMADGSDSSHGGVEQICKRYSAKDSRIKYKKLEKNLGISENTNACLEMATGDYIGLFDHDDLLHPAALHEVMRAICDRVADFIYTDEDKFMYSLDDAFCPHFKPDFAPDTLRANNYICHFTVFKAELLQKTGRFNPRCDGSQDFDMVLRLTEQAQCIVHIPEVLYHWRAHKGSVAESIGAKPYVIDAAHFAVEEHLKRVGLEGEVLDSPVPSIYQIKYKLKGAPLVSILIPNYEHREDLEKCLNSIYEKSTYNNFEVIIIENNSKSRAIFAYYEQLKKEHSNIKIVVRNSRFNYSAINNFGAQFARGEYLLLLNNDTEVISPEWIQEMLMYAQRSDVGAVGAKLYYPDDTIQHAGVILGMLGLAGHAFRGNAKKDPGYMGRLVYAQNLSVVTGACIMMRKDVWDKVGGLDAKFAVAFNDVDLCMRIRQAGYLIVWTPRAELYHYESKSRGLDNTSKKQARFNSEVKRFRKRWANELASGDPYYNPNFSLDREDFYFAVPERSNAPAAPLSHKERTKIWVKVIAKLCPWRIIERSTFFDKEWYSSTYGIPKEQAAKHYLEKGYLVGCQPSIDFDGDAYWKKYPDTAQMNPLLHYEVYGRKEGRTIEHNYNTVRCSKNMALQHKTASTPKIKFSIVVPLYNTPEKFLREMIQSVIDQTYANWELCMTDGSDDEHREVEQICKEYTAQDDRIKYKKLEKNLGISGNTNACLEMATGDYIGLFDHDDLLHPAALYKVMRAICERGADFVYTDENNFHDVPSDAFLFHFKPDFAPDTLRANNYICHFTVFKVDLLQKTGVFNPECDGSQDFDMVLRLTEQAHCVVHIPEVLYHWRAHKSSVAGSLDAKPYVFEAARRAIRAHLKRIGLVGEVIDSPAWATYLIKYKLNGTPLVSILIPNYEHREDLEKCLNSIYERSSYKNFEVVIIENNSKSKEIFAYYDQIQREHNNIKVVVWHGEFNYSAINNFGAQSAHGEYLLLLHNDTKVISQDWIQEMLMYAQRSDVGAVGAKLYYPDNTIQHAGIILGIDGTAGYVFQGVHEGNLGYMGRLIYAQNLSAVTSACMMLRRNVWNEVGGLDDKFAVAFNDVDLCVRIRKAGYLIVWTPRAELYHYESKNHGLEDTPEKQARFNSEVGSFMERWTKELESGDPYYNPNFLPDSEYSSLTVHGPSNAPVVPLCCKEQITKIVARRWPWRIIEHSPLFDKEWYSSAYGVSKGQAAKHYLEKGYLACCQPSVDFNGDAYRRKYPDAVEMNPLLHYEVYGRWEGRTIDDE